MTRACTRSNDLDAGLPSRTSALRGGGGDSRSVHANPARLCHSRESGALDQHHLPVGVWLTTERLVDPLAFPTATRFRAKKRGRDPRLLSLQQACDGRIPTPSGCCAADVRARASASISSDRAGCVGDRLLLALASSGSRSRRAKRFGAVITSRSGPAVSHAARAARPPY